MGSLDLPVIFFIEGFALADHRDPEDLRLAIKLLTLAIRSKMDAPGDPLAYQVIAYAGRASAYYAIGDFSKSVADSRKLVAMIPPDRHLLQDSYKLLTISLLRSGDYQSALAAAMEYMTRIGDPEARRWLDLVEFYPQNPQFALNELLKIYFAPVAKSGG
jgi:tetratricopeptide (TPR) repeat protein